MIAIMALQWIFIGVLLQISLALSSSLCPPDAQLKPCTCDLEGLNCHNVKDDNGLATVLNQIGKGNFRGFWVQSTNITSLRRNMFANYKFQSVYFDKNRIKVVEAGAFSNSVNILQKLSLYSNELTDFDFTDLRTFKELMNFNIARNKLSSIPPMAFANMENLNTIILAHNEIVNIGPQSFIGLNKLGRLDISFNKLKVLGPNSLTMTNHQIGLPIFLAHNQISEIDRESMNGLRPSYMDLSSNRLSYFDMNPFSDMIDRNLRQGIQIQINLHDNPFTCQGCRFWWMIRPKDLLLQILIGFQCTDGRSLFDLNGFNIGC